MVPFGQADDFAIKSIFGRWFSRRPLFMFRIRIRIRIRIWGIAVFLRIALLTYADSITNSINPLSPTLLCGIPGLFRALFCICLLYTSDAADE